MLYKPFEAAIRARATVSQGEHSTPARQFAEHVVAQVLGRRPPAHYAYGRYAGLFAFMRWMPIWVRDFFLARMFGLDKLLPLPAEAAAAPAEPEGESRLAKKEQ